MGIAGIFCGELDGMNLAVTVVFPFIAILPRIATYGVVLQTARRHGQAEDFSVGLPGQGQDCQQG